MHIKILITDCGSCSHEEIGQIVIGSESQPKASTSNDDGGISSGQKPAEEEPRTTMQSISDIIEEFNRSPRVIDVDGKSDGASSDTSPQGKFNVSKFKNKQSKVSKEIEKKNEFLQSISESLTSMAKFFTTMEEKPQQPEKPIEQDDDDLGWAKLLVSKIKRMSQELSDMFKVYIDNLAIKAINGEWP